MRSFDTRLVQQCGAPATKTRGRHRDHTAASPQARTRQPDDDAGGRRLVYSSSQRGWKIRTSAQTKETFLTSASPRSFPFTDRSRAVAAGARHVPPCPQPRGVQCPLLESQLDNVLHCFNLVLFSSCRDACKYAFTQSPPTPSPRLADWLAGVWGAAASALPPRPPTVPSATHTRPQKRRRAGSGRRRRLPYPILRQHPHAARHLDRERPLSSVWIGVWGGGGAADEGARPAPSSPHPRPHSAGTQSPSPPPVHALLAGGSPGGPRPAPPPPETPALDSQDRACPRLAKYQPGAPAAHGIQHRTIPVLGPMAGRQ